MDEAIESGKAAGLFGKYKTDPDPKKRKLAGIWAGSIGLQDVDGLSVSPYLVELAIKNVEGDVTIQEVNTLIDEYYRNKNSDD